MILYQIKIPYATFGVGIRNGKIVFTPTIAKWMIGKRLWEIIKWVKSKKGTVEAIKK